ncbi:BQ5605_C009g05779 [Microbotryum silenes-dioicae]|uniref:BQ5605_C009g05779 protein n=1 Tax=Microbotryum silenes-dioicae TaxID=796604 RepID=A0A2X0PG37_9BASI|nr:BQ5605_C009g05779 [Microbotryum silenes-dioicae]
MSFSSTHADRINEVLKSSTQNPHKGIPRVVLLVASSESPLIFSSSAGYAQLPDYPATQEDLDKAEKITPDSVFELWSCTKLVTSIATLQLIEKGQIGLDDDVTKYLPEVKNAKKYKGLDKDGKALTEELKTMPTIRMLLSHTAGLTYELTPAHAEAQKALGLPNVYSRASSKEFLLAMPFVYEPGTVWSYGTAIDYLALTIEAVTGGPLIDYFKKNIFGPLGISDMSYAPPSNRINMAYDDPADPSAPWKAGPGSTLKENRGGAGLFGSPASYLKIVRTLLGDGQPLFQKSETVEEMFEDQTAGSERFQTSMSQFMTLGSDPFFGEAEQAGHGLGGALTGAKHGGGRSKGTLSWSGYCNTFWVADRNQGVAYVFFTNSTPTFAHPRIFSLWEKIEKDIFDGALHGRRSGSRRQATL